jgi:hypothetical protein
MDFNRTVFDATTVESPATMMFGAVCLMIKHLPKYPHI